MTMTHNRVRLVATRFVAPAVVYFGFFSFYTWPWIKHFDSQFFANDGDGLQNVWNMWWVNRALTHLHQSPWHTNMLHAPYGTTLLGQTMNPFNGFVGVVLVPVLGIVRTYNALVIFSFVFGGVTAFWLCLWFTDRYVPSLVGGFVFTFSAFHFAHAIGHMQLVSLEWIPLFVLLWWKLLTAPSYGLAVGAAVALELVLLCDYYYFVYSVGAAILIAVYLWYKKEARGSKPLLVFAALFILVLPLPLQLLWYNAGDKLQGAHPARIFSTDLLTPFIDGGFWRFASLTDGYWRHVHNFVSESSIYVGVAILAVFVIAIVRRNRLHPDTVFWLLFAAVFGVLSLGPRLLVHGHSYARVPLPYALVEHVLPPFKLSGTPIRMMVMVTLAAAVLTAIVLARLDLSRWRDRLILGGFCVALVIEMWPAGLPRTSPTHPPYVDALKALPTTGIVFDGAAPDQNRQLYYQTIHEHPIVLGYVSRLPTSVATKDAVLIQDVRQQRFDQLCARYGIRYYATPASRPLRTAFPVVYAGADARIYDLKNSSKC